MDRNMEEHSACGMSSEGNTFPSEMQPTSGATSIMAFPGAPGTPSPTQGALAAHEQALTDEATDVIDDNASDTSSDYSDIWEDWVEEKDLAPAPHPSYIPFRRYKPKALSATIRTFLSDHLNEDAQGISSEGFAKDWRGLAECMGRDYENIESFDRFKDPTGELIKDWQAEPGSNMGKLFHYLQKLDRYDILEDVKFMDMVFQSVRTHEIEQEVIAKEREARRKERRLRKNPLLAIEDTEEEKAEFHGFVSFEEEDIEFVKELIYECETKAGLKLCLDARDLLGKNEQYVTAESIIARCTRTIAVVSHAFVDKDSEMSKFALRTAQGLSAAISQSKIIPIKIEACEMPISLDHINPVDFCRSHNRLWIWRKIITSLRSDNEPLSCVEKQKLRHFKLYPQPVPDLRASMAEESYEPPECPKYTLITREEVAKASSSRRTCRAPPALAAEGNITDATKLSKKNKLKRSIKKFFSSKTR